MKYCRHIIVYNATTLLYKMHTVSDIIFKLVVAGDSSVGKSSIVLRYSEDSFSTSFIPTIGVDFRTKNIKINNNSIKLQIWDTAGQERFRSVVNSYFRGAHGVVLVYDVCNELSFKNITNWKNNIDKLNNKNCKFILIGNKCDMKQRQVSYERGASLAKELNIPFYEVSAKTGDKIDIIFESLAATIKDDYVPDYEFKETIATKMMQSLFFSGPSRKCCILL